MAYLALQFEADAEAAERWSDLVLSHGALAVDIADAAGGTDTELPLFGEPGAPGAGIWARNRVRILFPEGTAPRALLESLQKEHALAPIIAMQELVVDEQDWVRLTQSQFGPIQVSPRLWVVPSWANLPDPKAISLRLDPGLAFGTGSHPTTQLCLAWLDQHLEPSASLLDYGCGSGVLAIAGALLGAQPVDGVDIDPQAIEAASQNAARNQVAAEFFLPGQEPARTYAVVVANILANPLCALAPLLVRRLAPGGSLVLSGILAAQAEQVIAAYRPWLNLEVSDAAETWVALAGTAARQEEHTP